MYKKLILLFLFISLAYPEFKANIASYSDNDAFISNYGVEYRLSSANSFVLSVGANYYKSPSTETIRASIKYDIAYDQEFSPFSYVGYNRNQTLKSEFAEVGLGISWLPNGLADKDFFPYKHKFSAALVEQTDRKEIVISLRYKGLVTIDQVDLGLTIFEKFFMRSADLNIQYKLSKTIALKHNFYYENIGTGHYVKSIFGIEITL
ncbi:MAG: hypothetical protein A2Y40_04490 [Candidatus Margulisbacteria bacterium GWF2_35_9]|nr:MAG: hypothetical protein A2Y40_04490 [Candidatus Margulisbacteria bacterium GWF2_35_9]